MQQRPAPAARRIAINGVEARVQCRQPFAVVITLRLPQGGFDGAQLGVAIQDVLDGGPRIGGRFLGDVGDHPVCGIAEISTVGMQFAQDQGKQAGFAGTVCTGDSHSLSRMDLEAGLLEEQPRPTPQAEISNLQHAGIVAPRGENRRPYAPLPWNRPGHEESMRYRHGRCRRGIQARPRQEPNITPISLLSR